MIEQDDLKPLNSGHRRNRYFKPHFVRWKVPEYKGKDLRIFPMYSLGLRRSELEDLEELKRFKRKFCAAACRLNKSTRLYKTKTSLMNFKRLARKAWRERDFTLFSEYVKSLEPTPPLEGDRTVGTYGEVPTGPYPYLSPLLHSGVKGYRFRGHRASIITNEAKSLASSEHIAYLLSLIEHTRNGFFDEETLQVVFCSEEVEVNDFSQVPLESYTYWYKDDAWYTTRSPAGHVVTKKVPKALIDPIKLREGLEAILDSPKGVHLDLYTLLPFPYGYREEAERDAEPGGPEFPLSNESTIFLV